jgi:hypothetical protein
MGTPKIGKARFHKRCNSTCFEPHEFVRDQFKYAYPIAFVSPHGNPATVERTKS